MAYSSFNKIFILGNLGQTPELRYSNAGNPVTRFSVATHERFRSAGGEDEDHTEWHRIVVFGTAAENCSKFLKKGSLVLVEGKLRTRKYYDKDKNERFVTEVIADMVHFLDLGGGERNVLRQHSDDETSQKETGKKEPSEKAFNNALAEAIKDIPSDDGDLPF